MTAEALILDDRVRNWIGDAHPLWTLLDPDMLGRFLNARTLKDSPTRINANLNLSDLEGSRVVNHSRLVLSALEEEGGAKLTATGNISRKFVARMVEEFRWPDHEKEVIYSLNKVVNEQDFTPLHYLHVVMKEAGLLRKYKGSLKPSRLGGAMLNEEAVGKLMQLLFTATFDMFNTAYIDRIPIRSWPQEQAGLTLYLLSQAAADWTRPGVLMRRVAIPTLEVINAPYDFPEFAFSGRILRYLVWFGLMEMRPPRILDKLAVKREYRKTALYDRFLAFDMKTSGDGGTVH
jgi:hypothetical protein